MSHSAQPAVRCPLPLTSRGSRTTAFHEAGHVVASVLCGHLVHQVQIGPYRGTLFNRHGQPVVCAGLTEGLPLADPSSIQTTLASRPEAKAHLRHRAVDNVFISGAGPAAEARFSRRGWQATVVGQSRYPDGDFADAMTALEPFVAIPRHRSCLVYRIWECSRRFVARPLVWNAVTTLAEQLRANGKMDCDQIEASVRRQGIERMRYGHRLLKP